MSIIKLLQGQQNWNTDTLSSLSKGTSSACANGRILPKSALWKSRNPKPQPNAFILINRKRKISLEAEYPRKSMGFSLRILVHGTILHFVMH